MRLENGYHELPPGKIAAAVTYLEMTEPPPARPVPDRPDLALRRVENPDPAWYRDLFRRVGAEWLWFGRLALTDAELAAVLHHPLVELHALASAGQDEGILELDRRQPPDIELAYFGLTANLVGHGAGRWLMSRALELAWAHRPRRLWLHTCQLDHPDALAFYRRSGFRPYRRAVEILDDPRLSGVLPRTAAPGVPIIAA